MAILEILTIDLGSSIAKAILKFWFKDNSIGADISSSLVDLIKKKTIDITAQQRAKRQFEEIGEKVAQNLFPLFIADKDKIDEGSQEAIAIEISKLLNNSPITSKLLAEKDLDANKLFAYLKDLHPDVTKNFTDAETALFNRSLSEISQNIIEIASQLPHFTDQTLAEILKRENVLIKITNQILDEVMRIHLWSESSRTDEQANDFEIQYRRAVIRSLDQVELFGVDVSSASRRHRLSVAYVTLDAKRISQKPRSDRDNSAYVHQVIKDTNRLFIKGDAGSGKTTLLKWIAVQSASSNFIRDMDEFNSYVPFFIRLRNFSERELPMPSEFPALISPTIIDLMPVGWVQKKLMSGKAFLLIDGLDEITEKKRDSVKKWLLDLVNTYPRARYLLSSRPVVLNEDWKGTENFEEAFLLPMKYTAIHTFIDHWHSAVQEVVEDVADRQELPSLAEHLQYIIQDNPQIESLATTPLLCALICALHRDRRKQLPKDRVELYRACTEMLLERREKESGIKYYDEYPDLSYRYKLAILKDCAYWFLKNDLSSVEVDKFDSHLNNKIQNMEIERAIDPNRIRKLFVERSGILREPIKGYIDFAHKTFQEFLAAQEIIEQGDIGFLIRNALDSQWSEVVVLAAGLAPHKVSDQIVSELIEMSEVAVDQESEFQYILLASACLETIVALSPSVRNRLKDKLAKLNPPININEAKKWSAAGDIAINYLATYARESMTKPEIGAECIRALTMIGSSRALNAIKELCIDAHGTILRTIVDGWGYFDRVEYAKNVLARNEKFDYFIGRVPDLRGLQYLPYLKKVTMYSSVINSLAGLEKLDLEYISLLNCENLIDIRALGSMTNVRVLSLSGCRKISDLSSLSDLDQLLLLDLSLCSSVRDFSPLRKLKKLQFLNLVGCNPASNFNWVAELTNLKLINLTNEMFETISLSDSWLMDTRKVKVMKYVEEYSALYPRLLSKPKRYKSFTITNNDPYEFKPMSEPEDILSSLRSHLEQKDFSTSSFESILNSLKIEKHEKEANTTDSFFSEVGSFVRSLAITPRSDDALSNLILSNLKSFAHACKEYAFKTSSDVQILVAGYADEIDSLGESDSYYLHSLNFPVPTKSEKSKFLL